MLIAASGLRDIKLKKGETVNEAVVFTADPLPEIILLKDGVPVSGDKKNILKTETKELENGLIQYTCTLNIKDGKNFHKPIE